MELKVIWTDPAIEDLRQIRNYIAEDNPSATVSFGMELFKARAILEGSRSPAGCSRKPRTAPFVSCFIEAIASFIKNAAARLRSCTCVMAHAETRSFDRL